MATKKQKLSIDEVKNDAFAHLEFISKVRRVSDFANTVVKGLSELPRDVALEHLNTLEYDLMGYIGTIIVERQKLE